MALDIFALVVILILIAVAIFIVVKVGPIPGNIARKRGHPQADAVMALGWIGIVTLGIAWPFALVWAYVRSPEQQTRDLGERVSRLEAELNALKSGGSTT